MLKTVRYFAVKSSRNVEQTYEFTCANLLQVFQLLAVKNLRVFHNF